MKELSMSEIRTTYDKLQSGKIMLEPPSIVGNNLIMLLGEVLDRLEDKEKEFIRMEDSWRREVLRQEHERCEVEIKLESLIPDGCSMKSTCQCEKCVPHTLDTGPSYGLKPEPHDWVDDWGACKVCDGEIPHGHAPDCAYYVLEIQLKDALAAQEAMIEEAAEDQLRIKRLKLQLPEGMESCTIISKRCEVGHSWLSATNWEQHEDAGCRQCSIVEANKLITKLVEAQRRGHVVDMEQDRLIAELQPLIGKHVFKW